jgi:hypothetical protein
MFGVDRGDHRAVGDKAKASRRVGGRLKHDGGRGKNDFK